MSGVSTGILNSLLSRTLTLPGWESSLSDGLLCLMWAVGHLCSQIWSDLPSKDRSLRSIQHLLLITDSLDVDSGYLGDFSCFETNRPPRCGHDNQKHHCRAKNRPYNNCYFVKLVSSNVYQVAVFALILAESLRWQFNCLTSLHAGKNWLSWGPHV